MLGVEKYKNCCLPKTPKGSLNGCSNPETACRGQPNLISLCAGPHRRTQHGPGGYGFGTRHSAIQARPWGLRVWKLQEDVLL